MLLKAAELQERSKPQQPNKPVTKQVAMQAQLRTPTAETAVALLLPVLTCCQALYLLGEGGTEQHGLALAGGGHVLTLNNAPAGQKTSTQRVSGNPHMTTFANPRLPHCLAQAPNAANISA